MLPPWQPGAFGLFMQFQLARLGLGKGKITVCILPPWQPGALGFFMQFQLAPTLAGAPGVL